MVFRIVQALRPPRHLPTNGLMLAAACLVLAAAGLAAEAADEPPHSAELDRMIVSQANRNGVPEKLVRRIVMRESKYDPRARNHRYWGLMQISYPTAKSMGFKGTPDQLLNPLVNLTYAVPYLANAFIIAGKHEDEAVRLYAAGYYFTARQRGLLSVLRTAESAPMAGAPADAEEVVATTAPPPPPSGFSIFGSLFGASPAPVAPPVAPEQVASATPEQVAAAPDAASAPVQATLPAPAADGKSASADDVALVAGKDGQMEPPKKWLHDGGMTQVARGEQPVDEVAAYAAASDDKPARKDDKPARKTASHSHKTDAHKSDVFASIDMAPASAQAYASAEGQDPHLAQASSQDAITQATSVQPAAYAPQDASQPAPQLASAAPLPDAAGQDDHAGDETAKAPRKVAHKSHRDGTTKIAKAKAKTVVADAAPAKHTAHHAKTNDDAPVVASRSPDDDGLRH